MEAKQGAGRKKKVLTVLAVVLVVVVAAGGGVALRWWQDRDEVTGPKDLPAAIDTSQNLASSGDFEGAHEEIDKALSNPKLSAKEKYELYLQQGTTYYNEGKYQQALDSYKKAAAAQETQGLYEVMANTAQQLGDNQSAIAYLKKAIALIPESNPVGGADKESYEIKIRELGGQP